jgi:hypothetical protein
VYASVILTYSISAAVVLVASLGLTVQFSLPYNRVGRASVLAKLQWLQDPGEELARQLCSLR